MAQNRKPPAFQEYAAYMLVSKPFRSMTLEERGLLSTMRYECWENMDVPSSIHLLAKHLGFDVDRIKSALTENVKSFFIENDGVYKCPELDNYRQHLEERKAKQSEGGKFGSKMTNHIRATNKSSSPSNSQVPRQGSPESLVQLSIVKHSQEQSSVSEVKDNWINDYNNGEHDDLVIRR